MYETWKSRDEGRAAVAKKRRAKQNRRTYWASTGAFMLGWLLTTASALATVEPDEASSTLRSMATYGLAIVTGMVLTMTVVSLGRWFEPTLYGWLASRLGRPIPALAHGAVWVGYTALIAVPFGVGVAALWRPFGLSFAETAAIVAISLFALIISAGFALAPAERRRQVSHEILSEAVAAERLAALTPGEEEILEQMRALEKEVAGIQRVGHAVEPHLPPYFTSWGAWWDARPRRRPS